MFAAAQRLRPRLEPARPVEGPGDAAAEAASGKDEEAALPVTALTGHVVLVGYGRVGSIVGSALQKRAIPFLVIEDAAKAVAELRESGAEVIVDNAAKPAVLHAANLPEASRLVLAIPNAFEAGQVVRQARAANPVLLIVARAHSDAEVDYLEGLGADVVIMGEREIALGMIAEVDRSTDGAEAAGPKAAPTGQGTGETPIAQG
jgi:CPA2 family monovalent cation:H+ antiporter-2